MEWEQEEFMGWHGDGDNLFFRVTLAYTVVAAADIVVVGEGCQQSEGMLEWYQRSQQ